MISFSSNCIGSIKQVWIDLGLEIQQFIAWFYGCFLGVLYLALYALGIFIGAKRHPYLDWQFQGALVPFIQVSMIILVIGFVACCLGVIVLATKARQKNPKVRVLLFAGSIAVPILAYIFALISGGMILRHMNYHLNCCI
jgi:hypothetical protein